MKQKVGFDYWNTLVKHINTEEFKLNGEILHDARTIKKIQYLWKSASERYVKNLDKEDFIDLWCDIDSLSKNQCYETLCKEFIGYLYYASDRMTINRWTYLQLCINKAADLVYLQYCETYDWKEWSNKICDGYNYGLREWNSNLYLQCRKEWKQLIGKEK